MSNRINLNGEIYEIIEIIKMGNHSYPVIKKGDDITYLEQLQSNDKISYVLPSKDFSLQGNQGKSLEHLNQNILMNHIIETLKSDIRSGKYESKEDLIKRIKEIQQFIDTDYQIKGFLKGDIEGLTLESFQSNLKGMLDYFDEYNNDVNLNLENVSSIKTENGEYIKYESKDGIKILEDNVSNKTFAEQFRDEQNKYASLQSSDGNLSTEKVFDSLEQHQKISVDMDSLDSYDKKDMTNEQISSSNAVKSLTDDPFIIANPEHNLFIDDDGNELTTERKDNEIIINKAEESTNGEISSKEEIDSIDFGSLTDSDIYILLTEKRHLLTEEQIDLLEKIQEQRRIQDENKSMENGKRPKSIGEHPSTKNGQAAYTNLFILCTITWLFAFGMIIYIFMNL